MQIRSCISECNFLAHFNRASANSVQGKNHWERCCLKVVSKKSEFELALRHIIPIRTCLKNCEFRQSIRYFYYLSCRCNPLAKIEPVSASRRVHTRSQPRCFGRFRLFSAYPNEREWLFRLSVYLKQFKKTAFKTLYSSFVKPFRKQSRGKNQGFLQRITTLSSFLLSSPRITAAAQ